MSCSILKSQISNLKSQIPAALAPATLRSPSAHPKRTLGTPAFPQFPISNLKSASSQLTTDHSTTSPLHHSPTHHSLLQQKSPHSGVAQQAHRPVEPRPKAGSADTCRPAIH